MNKNNDILQELTDMQSPLAHISRSMPYSVPVGYFESLEKYILNTAHFAHIPDPVLRLGKTMPHTVPAGYFESLAQEVSDRVEETETVLPKTIMPYTAPHAYFDNLPGQVLSRVATTQTTPAKTTVVIELWRQVRWVAAAILLLAMGVGSLNKFAKPIPVNPELALSHVSKMDISNYVEQNIDDLDAEMIADNFSSNDITILAKQLNDDDIIQYLDENGWDHAE